MKLSFREYCQPIGYAHKKSRKKQKPKKTG